ncbi:MAG: tyrosine-type recombinase/integrase [Hyphomicrobiaceae bacterium]
MPIVNLTARYVETVKARGGRLEVRDAKIEGLELRVSAAGSKVWALRYRRQSDGTKRTHTLGSYPDMTLEEARDAAHDARRSVAKGGDPAAEKQARKAAETFSELADEWIERHGKPNKSERAVRDDRSMLDRHILPEIGSMKAGEIAKRDVIRLLDTVAAKGDARGKAKAVGKSKPARKLTHRPNRVFEVVRAIFRWAVGRDLLKVDPTFGISPPIKKERARERELSLAEIRTLWLALDRAPVSREAWKRKEGDFPMRRATALAIKLSLVTAQRIGEVTGIALAELDLNDTAPMWVVPGERSKNGEPNRVPLSPVAVRIIAEARSLAGESAWLFPSPRGDGPMEAHAATKATDRARPAIGIADIRVHDMRRTAATRMAELGISPHTVSLVLNHVSVRRGTITGKVYDRYSYDREKREALGAWGARLERIIAGNDGLNVVSFAAQ